MNKEVKPKKQVKKAEETSLKKQKESEVLKKRKAQAAELAEKISPDFSLDKELHEIKTTLLDSEEPSGLINEKGEVVKLPEQEASKSAGTKATKSKAATSVAKETPKQTSTKKATTTKKATATKTTSTTKKTVVKKEASIEATLIESGEEDKKVIDNLQKLKDQIQAQKSLERELMKREAIKVQDKDIKLMDKLTALEELIKQTDVTTDGESLELEAQIRKLSKQLSQANSKILELQNEMERSSKEGDQEERAALIETIQRNEVRYNLKINELEELIKEQQVQVEERIRIELSKQKSLQAKIKKLEQAKAEAPKASPAAKASPKELEALKEKLEKEFATKTAQLQKQNEALATKHEKALLKKEEETVKKLAAQKVTYETRIKTQREKAKLDLKEEKAKILEASKLSDNEALQKLSADYEAKLATKDKEIQAAKKEAQVAIKEEKATLKAEQSKANKEYRQKVKAEFDAKILTYQAENLKTDSEEIRKLQESFAREKENLKEEKELALKKLREEFQERLVEVEKTYEKSESLIKENYEVKSDKEIEKLNDLVKKLEQELAASNKENEALLQRIKELEQELAAARKENEVLLQRIKELEARLAHGDDEQKTITSLEQKLAEQSATYQKTITSLEQKLAEQSETYQKQLEEERARSLSFINEATKDRTVQREALNEEIKEIRIQSEQKITTIQLKLDEANLSLETTRRDLQNLKSQYELSSKQLQEEKNQYSELERRLQRELDERNSEVKKLKEDIERVMKASESNKLETQLNQIAKLVDELGNKTKETPYTKPSFGYDYEIHKLLAEQLRREDAASEKRKQRDLQDDLDKKISGLESQILELTNIMKSKPADKKDETDIIKSLNDDLETFKKQLKEEVEKEFKPKEEPADFSLLRKLVDEYKRDKDALLFEHNNEINNLEVDKKFVTNIEILKTIEEKIRLAKLAYMQRTKERDIKFQKDLAALGNYGISLDSLVYIQAAQQTPTPTPPAEVEKEEVKEPSPSHISKHSTVVYSRPLFTDAFVGTVDQEYLRRLENIRQLRLQLEDSRRETVSTYEADLVSIREQEARLLQKIAELQERLDYLKLEFDKKPFNNANRTLYENENTRLNIELESRQEQLRQLRDEDLLKLANRHQKVLESIDNQLRELLEEERLLKEEYILKQQKLENKNVRKEEIEIRILAEQEGRIIESQEAIKEKALQEEPVVSEEPVAPEEEPTPSEPEEEDDKLSSKERELKEMYNKYVNAQKKLQSDFPECQEYHETLESKMGYELEDKKILEKLAKIQKLAKEAKTPEEKKAYSGQERDLIISRDLYRDKIAFCNTNLERLSANRRVSDYIKILERIEIMDNLLKQYASRRG